MQCWAVWGYVSSLQQLFGHFCRTLLGRSLVTPWELQVLITVCNEHIDLPCWRCPRGTDWACPSETWSTEVRAAKLPRGVRAMPGSPGCEPDYTSRRAPRGGAARGRFRVGPRGVFTSGRASARVSARGGHPAAAPPAAGEGPTDRPTDRGRDRRTQRPSEEPRARSGAGPHEQAVSGESAAAGACRRGGTQPWTGSWGEWGPVRVPPCGAVPARPRRPRCRTARAPRAALMTNQFCRRERRAAAAQPRASLGEPPAPAGTAGCAAALASSRALARWKSNFSFPFGRLGGPGVAALCASHPYGVGLIPLRQNIALNRKACQGLNGFLWGGRRDLGRD